MRSETIQLDEHEAVVDRDWLKNVGKALKDYASTDEEHFLADECVKIAGGSVEEPDKLTSPLDKLKQNIKSYFKNNPDKYVWNTSSCGDHPNWDKTYHAALLQLRRDGMEGYTISASLSFGVHDWTVTRDM